MTVSHPVMLRKFHLPGCAHPTCVFCGERVFATVDEVQ